MNAVHLIGAEDVRSAGCAMQHAAEAMQQAADSFDNALERHRQWMEEWLSRFEAAVEKAADPFAPVVEPKAVCLPCPVPTDPEQRLDITCAHCGVAIDFRKGEVFVNVNGSSYVCKTHAANDPAVAPELLPDGKDDTPE
jgi:hypothetical protein